MKNKITAALLAFFLGGFGVHQFYLGNGSKGTMYLIFCWSGVPFILAFIDMIILLTMSEDSFNRKYNTTYTPPVHNITVNVPSTGSNSSITDELNKLHDLKAKGAITDAEYETQKQRILR